MRNDLGGDYARDTHREGFGDDYARDGGWSGGGRADDHVRETPVEEKTDADECEDRERRPDGAP